MNVRCWYCDGEIDAAVVEREGYLLPRRTSEGGPLWLLPCPHCGTRNGGEKNAAGAFLLVPHVAPGLRGWIAALSSPGRLVLRAHARAWFRRHAAGRRAFHAEPRSARPQEPEEDVPAGAIGQPPPPEAGPPLAGEDAPAGGEDAAREETARVSALLDHYGTLGVSLSATREEITAAYHRLSQRCHPDKVAHLDEEFQELADRKFRALRDAYEAILESLGAAAEPPDQLA
jgi:hypothetical protein